MSLTQWTWKWANSGRQWRSEEPGRLQSMRLQRVGHKLANGQQQQVVFIAFNILNVYWRQLPSKLEEELPLCCTAWNFVKNCSTIQKSVENLAHKIWMTNLKYPCLFAFVAGKIMMIPHIDASIWHHYFGSWCNCPPNLHMYILVQPSFIINCFVLFLIYTTARKLDWFLEIQR